MEMFTEKEIDENTETHKDVVLEQEEKDAEQREVHKNRIMQEALYTSPNMFKPDGTHPELAPDIPTEP